jgi:hypothetical protein
MRMNRSSITGDGPNGGSIIAFDVDERTLSAPASSTRCISTR